MCLGLLSIDYLLTLSEKKIQEYGQFNFNKQIKF